MAMADTGKGSYHPHPPSPFTDSQSKYVCLVRVLAATQHLVCIYQMNWVNSHNGSTVNIIWLLLLQAIKPLLGCGQSGRPFVSSLRKLAAQAAATPFRPPHSAVF